MLGSIVKLQLVGSKASYREAGHRAPPRLGRRHPTTSASDGHGATLRHCHVLVGSCGYALVGANGLVGWWAHADSALCAGLGSVKSCWLLVFP